MNNQACLHCQNPQCNNLTNCTDPCVQEAKKRAMSSDYGAMWENKHGRYFISKEGEFTHMNKSLPYFFSVTNKTPDLPPSLISTIYPKE